jgi:dTDP-4-dehydrorhamnose reductase
MRLYVIGREGQIARALREMAACSGDIVFASGARPEVDLLQPSSIAKALDDFQPDLVVNPAAYTGVDKAEAEPDQAFAVNRDGAREVAAAAGDRGLPILHLSTDYVFDGKKGEAYVESDTTNPLNVYGKSKLAGELAVAEVNPKHVILRTSWVYAPFGKNFVRDIIRLANDRDRLRVVDDQSGCPTYAPDIAHAIIAIACKLTASGWQPAYQGVTHIAGPDVRTWCGFARDIVAEAVKRGGRSIPVDPIVTADYPTAAARPANSRLSSGRLESLFDVRLPSLAQSLRDCLDRLLQH